MQEASIVEYTITIIVRQVTILNDLKNPASPTNSFSITTSIKAHRCRVKDAPAIHVGEELALLVRRMGGGEHRVFIITPLLTRL